MSTWLQFQAELMEEHRDIQYQNSKQRLIKSVVGLVLLVFAINLLLQTGVDSGSKLVTFVLVLASACVVSALYNVYKMIKWRHI